MTEEQKQSLIEYCEAVISAHVQYGGDSDEEQVFRLALTALTAQPVKAPDTKCIGWVKDSIKEHDKKWLDAIRAAGYEVQE